MNMSNRTPNHIGIIIDGNRRWAKERKLPTLEGHRKGLENIKKIGRLAWKNGVKIITVYAFSTENWNRSKLEVAYLMKLLSYALSKKNIEEYHKLGIKIQIIGQKRKFSKDIQTKIKQAEKFTKNNKNGVLNLAISYGGRPEIIEAVKKIIKDKTPADKVSENLINTNLWTKGCPDPDLVIRTGGHQRLSNFLTWQTAYSELYFINKYWPEFNKNDLEKAFEYYYFCQRNFGK